MLSASRPDTNFFSSSSAPASSSAPSAVTTRVVTVQRTPKPLTHALKLTARPATPVDPPSSPSSGSSRKRRAASGGAASRASKKRRISPSGTDSDDDCEARSPSVSSDRSRASSATPSRYSSLSSRTLQLTRSSSSRSRSTSVLPHAATESDPMPPREVWITENGRPGPGFLSSESVVKELMRTYISRTAVQARLRDQEARTSR